MNLPFDWTAASTSARRRASALPTEAEWELDAPAPMDRKYAWGKDARRRSASTRGRKECVAWGRSHGVKLDATFEEMTDSRHGLNVRSSRWATRRLGIHRSRRERRRVEGTSDFYADTGRAPRTDRAARAQRNERTVARRSSPRRQFRGTARRTPEVTPSASAAPKTL